MTTYKHKVLKEEMLKELKKIKIDICVFTKTMKNGPGNAKSSIYIDS